MTACWAASARWLNTGDLIPNRCSPIPSFKLRSFAPEMGSTLYALTLLCHQSALRPSRKCQEPCPCKVGVPIRRLALACDRRGGLSFRQRGTPQGLIDGTVHVAAFLLAPDSECRGCRLTSTAADEVLSQIRAAQTNTV